MENRVSIHILSRALEFDSRRLLVTTHLLASGASSPAATIALARALSGLEVDRRAEDFHCALFFLDTMLVLTEELLVIAYPHSIDVIVPLVLVVSTIALVLHVLAERAATGLCQKCRPVEILSVLGQHLEVDEVGELVANHGAVDEDVVLFLHQLAECVDVERASDAREELRILQVGRKLVERLRRAAERHVKTVKFCHLIVRDGRHFFL